MDCIEARRTQLGCVHSSDNQPWFTHWEDVNHDFTMYFFDGSSTVKTMQNKDGSTNARGCITPHSSQYPHHGAASASPATFSDAREYITVTPQKQHYHGKGSTRLHPIHSKHCAKLVHMHDEGSTTL
eukprot:scaffold45_cov337-Pavlova_lutheri.AAC.38